MKMLRAKLLNRSGWKAAGWSVLALILVVMSATGNAQQGTLGLSSQTMSTRQTISRPATKSSATTTTQSRTNQQPQHRVSVAPQGGELGKGTGAATFGVSVLGEHRGELLTCTSWDGADAAKGCVLSKDASLDELMSVILKSERQSSERCERDKKYILDKIGEALNGKK